jgi:hypothetical protein
VSPNDLYEQSIHSNCRTYSERYRTTASLTLSQAVLNLRTLSARIASHATHHLRVATLELSLPRKLSDMSDSEKKESGLNILCIGEFLFLICRRTKLGTDPHALRRGRRAWTVTTPLVVRSHGQNSEARKSRKSTRAVEVFRCYSRDRNGRVSDGLLAF